MRLVAVPPLLVKMTRLVNGPTAAVEALNCICVLALAERLNEPPTLTVPLSCPQPVFMTVKLAWAMAPVATTPTSVPGGLTASCG